MGYDMGVSNDIYLSLLDRLIRVTHVEPFARDVYVELIHEIGECYNLSKGDTEFYTTSMMEMRGMGEYYCDFDKGVASKILLRLRVVSTSKAIIIGTLYEAADYEDRPSEEVEQLDTMLRVILGFVSRRRLVKKLEDFGFMDIEGYRNFRAFARHIDICNSENRLGGKVAFHIDLHNFNVVNHEVGRENGDKVMRKYYEMVQETIGDEGIISRLGGDKFIGLFDRSVKRNVFELFNGAVVPYDEKGQKKIRVSASAGIYMLPNPYMLKSYGDIMDKIMLAGNTAKRQAGGGIVVYDDKMKMAREHIKKVQSDFRDALENEEFAVFYQPKVDINTKKLYGAEALCRWIKGNTIVPPIEFIPILEMNTDICDLDFYMLDHVCADIRRWLDEGREVVRVSVNLSRKHLVDVDLLEHIISIIDKHNVPHEYIEVELTETTTDVMFNDLRRVVCGLQQEGIWTAVDDFGVGYSSLNLIRDIPWNVLKIDKSFVPKDVEEEDSVSNKMFKHVIMLAHDMGLECVIEGVETLDQLEVLRRNGCNIAQGYFFDRPLPLEDFEQRLNPGYYE
ncbi:diguanylate cyclase (GGDEF) domain-containing protein [Lachnospiraceae bacterium NE2001]|nr:diguanylate cyclase (GGDEF) domain-containing protein [Lachnospiraceae bacterium NE2001]